MNRVANEYHIPFRCVTQWATHQTGKLYDTLGVKLESPNLNKESIMGLNALLGGQNGSTPPSAPKKPVRGKKLNEKSKKT